MNITPDVETVVNNAWGEWVIKRSRFVGFRKQSDLARAVGCRVEQISRWAQLNEPPTHMRKGFDQSLPRALKIDQMTLFRSWKFIPAELVPEVQIPMASPIPWRQNDPGDVEFRQFIIEALDGLTTDELFEVSMFVGDLVVKRGSRVVKSAASLLAKSQSKKKPDARK